MPSLRFTKPLNIASLSEQAAQECVGLEVPVRQDFTNEIGVLYESSQRRWDDELMTWRFDPPAPPSICTV